MKGMKVLFFTEGRFSPSTRFRVLQYLPYLAKENIGFHVEYFRDSDFPFGVGLDGPLSYAVAARDIVKRAAEITQASRYDLVFLQRELLPWNSSLLERFLSGMNRRIIFDFDDPIYLSVKGKPDFTQKIRDILLHAKIATVANQSLADFARRFAETEVIPMAVDTTKYVSSPDAKRAGKIRIGWMGTATNKQFLRTVAGPLGEVVKSGVAEFVLISGTNTGIPGVSADFVPWAEDTEVRALGSLDIGIVPLDDGPQAQGKFPIKLLQFMSMGIPVVCSNTGMPAEIIRDGGNGFLARTEDDWKQKLRLLIGDRGLREGMGRAGRVTVEDDFSVKNIFPKLLNVFRKACV